MPRKKSWEYNGYNANREMGGTELNLALCALFPWLIVLFNDQFVEVLDKDALLRSVLDVSFRLKWDNVFVQNSSYSVKVYYHEDSALATQVDLSPNLTHFLAITMFSLGFISCSKFDSSTRSLTQVVCRRQVLCSSLPVQGIGLPTPGSFAVRHESSFYRKLH